MSSVFAYTLLCGKSWLQFAYDCGKTVYIIHMTFTVLAKTFSLDHDIDKLCNFLLADIAHLSLE